MVSRKEKTEYGSSKDDNKRVITNSNCRLDSNYRHIPINKLLEIPTISIISHSFINSTIFYRRMKMDKRTTYTLCTNYIDKAKPLYKLARSMYPKAHYTVVKQKYRYGTLYKITMDLYFDQWCALLTAYNELQERA